MEKRQHKRKEFQNKMYLHAHNPFWAIGTINAAFCSLKPAIYELTLINTHTARKDIDPINTHTHIYLIVLHDRAIHEDIKVNIFSKGNIN